jgi:hypothetical protein
MVVSHTAANAIVQLLLLLPLFDRTMILSRLEAISRHELVAHGRDVRLNRNGCHQSGYALLLGVFRSFVDVDTEQEDENTEQEDGAAAAEMAAAEALGSQAEIVVERMQTLNCNVSLIHRLHEAVHTRAETAFRHMGDVNPVNDLHELSELSSVPSVDVVNHGDIVRDSNTK